MANLPIKDGAGNSVFRKARGTGTDLDPYISEMSVGNFPGGTIVTDTPTLDTSAYAVGDVLFGQRSLANATLSAGRRAIIDRVTVLDADDTGPSFTLVFFRDTFTIAAANAAWNVSDADMIKAVGQVSFVNADFKDYGNNRLAVRSTYIPVIPASGTTIYFAGFADSASTYSASGLTIRISVTWE